MIRNFVLLLLLGSAALGCGPVQSTAYLLDAEVQIEAARTAQAEKMAPYEWTAANLYIRKAREESGYSNFEAAVTFARKASKFAREAKESAIAVANKQDPASALPPATEGTQP
jgi:hypothetical protein